MLDLGLFGRWCEQANNSLCCVNAGTKICSRFECLLAVCLFETLTRNVGPSLGALYYARQSLSLWPWKVLVQPFSHPLTETVSPYPIVSSTHPASAAILPNYTHPPTHSSVTVLHHDGYFGLLRSLSTSGTTGKKRTTSPRKPGQFTLGRYTDHSSLRRRMESAWTVR